MTPGRVALAGLSMILAVAAIGVSASADEYATARAATAEAQAAAKRGDWEPARRRLIVALRMCGSGDVGERCRSLIQFNLGYLFERWSRSAAERRDELLRLSAEAYQGVLDNTPGHTATVTNLALVLFDLGDVDQLRSLFDEVGRSSKPQAGEIAILLGDLHRSAGRLPEAYAAYEWAVDLAPESDVPRRKMVEIHAELPAPDDVALLRRLRDWELRFPAAAEAGYAAVLGKRPSQPEIMETALLRWVFVASALRRMSVAFIDERFPSSGIEPLRDLRRYQHLLEEGQPGGAIDRHSAEELVHQPPGEGEFGWWTASASRRIALAQAAFASGQVALAAKRPDQAEWRWLVGLRMSPDVFYFVNNAPERSEPFVYLDLLTELTWLQVRFPQLDPNGGKFALFIDLLFESKGEAYRAHDLATIQRHHTILGQIFAARGTWTQGRGDFDNAVFQLRRAIEVAEQRAQDGAPHEPQAGLKALLAEAYANGGQGQEAGRAYFSAAQAYLETDGLADAQSALDSSRRLTPEIADTDAFKSLEKVVKTRHDIQSLSTSDRPAFAVTGPKWLDPVELPGLPQEFRTRQQFKASADLAKVFKTWGDPTMSATQAKRALEAAEQLSTLIGTADLSRVESAVAAMRGQPQTAGWTFNLFADPAQSPAAKTWRVTLPSGDVPYYAAVVEPPPQQ